MKAQVELVVEGPFIDELLPEHVDGGGSHAMARSVEPGFDPDPRPGVVAVSVVASVDPSERARPVAWPPLLRLFVQANVQLLEELGQPLVVALGRQSHERDVRLSTFPFPPR